MIKLSTRPPAALRQVAGVANLCLHTPQSRVSLVRASQETLALLLLTRPRIAKNQSSKNLGGFTKFSLLWKHRCDWNFLNSICNLGAVQKRTVFWTLAVVMPNFLRAILSNFIFRMSIGIVLQFKEQGGAFMSFWWGINDLRLDWKFRRRTYPLRKNS